MWNNLLYMLKCMFNDEKLSNMHKISKQFGYMPAYKII